MKHEDLNGWCRNCDNENECKHLNKPSCEDFMFRSDGVDFDFSSFVLVDRKNPCRKNTIIFKDDNISK